MDHLLLAMEIIPFALTCMTIDLLHESKQNKIYLTVFPAEIHTYHCMRVSGNVYSFRSDQLCQWRWCNGKPNCWLRHSHCVSTFKVWPQKSQNLSGLGLRVLTPFSTLHTSDLINTLLMWYLVYVVPKATLIKLLMFTCELNMPRTNGILHWSAFDFRRVNYI